MEFKHSKKILVLAAAFFLAACTSPKPAPVSSEAGGEEESSIPAGESKGQLKKGEFEMTTDLTKEYGIHTTAQQTYLDYEGDFSKIDPSKYPDGKSSISDPVAVKLEWNHTPAADKTVSNYSVVYGQKADLSDGYEVMGSSAKSLDLYNSYIGNNYFKIIANMSDGSKEESEIQILKIKNNGPRNLKVGNMTNCRDLGGRATEDGGTIKQGLIYRTCGNRYDYSTSINDEGKEVMFNLMKVKSEINVSNDQNYNFNFGGKVVTKDFLMDYGQGNPVPSSHHLSRNAESVKAYFNYLADEKNYPVFYHCRIGTDRTGLCTILTMGLLGVNKNTIYQDYLFSNFGKIGEKRYIGTKAGQDNIENYMNEIEQIEGKTFKNKVYNFLLSVGVPAANLNKIIGLLTEGQQAKDNDAGQIVKTADQFTLDGATLSSGSGRNDPAKYTSLSSGKSASIKVTASKAFKGQLVAYMGNNNHSTTKKIADAVGFKLDGTDGVSKNQTYAAAGMGNCNNRTNYYPVILGEVDLTAGEHTITLNGKSSDAFKVGTISVFGAANASGDSQGGGDTNLDPAHKHTFGTPNGTNPTFATCACGAEKITFAALNDATKGKNKPGTPDGYLKLNANGDEVSYTITVDKAMSGKIYLDSVMDSWSGNQNNNFYSVKNSANTHGNFELKINDTAVDYSATKSLKYSDMYANGTDAGLGSTYSGRAEVEVGAMALKAGANTISFKRIDSYNPLVKNFVIVAK